MSADHGAASQCDHRVLTADWAGNKTYVMEFDWSRGEVGEKMELADVEWPTNIKMTSASKRITICFMHMA